MSIESFLKLHAILKPLLEKKFKRNLLERENSYYLSTDIRLSITLHYFSGGDPYDLMLSHGMSHASIYKSSWGVIDCINECSELSFHFPTFDEQREISNGFMLKSGAEFENIIGVIDGMLVWTTKPYKTICDTISCGETNFYCSRKCKYGINLQAICDHTLQFTWIDIRYPGSASDYISWKTSDLCLALDDDIKKTPTYRRHILYGKTIIGDNAYVRRMYMAVPLKGARFGHEDGYNFYLSQIRITIERAFGVLVKRWAVLRRTMMYQLPKVGPLVKSLCCLHNFCIREGDNSPLKSLDKDTDFLVKYCRKRNTTPVVFDKDGLPTELLDGGLIFDDINHASYTDENVCQMGTMMRQVKDKGLVLPDVKTSNYNNILLK